MRENMGMFRGKDEKGVWRYGNLITDIGATIIAEEGVECHYIVDPATVGECTGLTDKNGKEIYEGDIRVIGGAGNAILKFGLYDNEQHYEAHIYGFGFYWSIIKSGEIFDFNYFMFPELNEYVGNIHDNPELLEENQNDGWR